MLFGRWILVFVFRPLCVSCLATLYIHLNNRFHVDGLWRYDRLPIAAGVGFLERRPPLTGVTVLQQRRTRHYYILI